MSELQGADGTGKEQVLVDRLADQVCKRDREGTASVHLEWEEVRAGGWIMLLDLRGAEVESSSLLSAGGWDAHVRYWRNVREVQVCVCRCSWTTGEHV